MMGGDAVIGGKLTSLAMGMVAEEVFSETAPLIGTGSTETPFLTIETTVIPLPAAVWLFGSGLLGLIGFARRKSTVARME
jgi:hypothetical protein